MFGTQLIKLLKEGAAKAKAAAAKADADAAAGGGKSAIGHKVRPSTFRVLWCLDHPRRAGAHALKGQIGIGLQCMKIV